MSQKSIALGENITINYSAPFYAAPRADRAQYLLEGFVYRCECEACRQDWPLFDLLPSGPSNLMDDPVETSNGLRSKSDQSLVETFNRVRSRVEQLQAHRLGAGPPSKVLIQSQVRLYRCLLAMYSSKLHTLKTGSGSLPIPV